MYEVLSRKSNAVVVLFMSTGSLSLRMNQATTNGDGLEQSGSQVSEDSVPPILERSGTGRNDDGDEQKNVYEEREVVDDSSDEGFLDYTTPGTCELTSEELLAIAIQMSHPDDDALEQILSDCGVGDDELNDLSTDEEYQRRKKSWEDLIDKFLSSSTPVTPEIIDGEIDSSGQVEIPRIGDVNIEVNPIVEARSPRLSGNWAQVSAGLARLENIGAEGVARLEEIGKNARAACAVLRPFQSNQGDSAVNRPISPTTLSDPDAAPRAPLVRWEPGQVVRIRVLDEEETRKRHSPAIIYKDRIGKVVRDVKKLVFTDRFDATPTEGNAAPDQLDLSQFDVEIELFGNKLSAFPSLNENTIVVVDRTELEVMDVQPILDSWRFFHKWRAEPWMDVDIQTFKRHASASEQREKKEHDNLRAFFWKTFKVT